MRNNTQWFQSPRPSCFNLAPPHQHPEHFPELPPHHPTNITPTSIVHHPLSPFIPVSNNNQDEREEGRRGIAKLVVFSEQEEEDVTPEGQAKTHRNEEILTTGRKSSVQRPPAKKTRPKDKGLRGLSLKALQTVVAMGQGTYKQVATRLLSTLAEEGEGLKSANEETNIKRRVYDALNVLISLGLLRKEGRLIVGDRAALSPKPDRKEYNRLRSKLAVKEFVLEEKREKWRETEEKCRGIEGLFRRNQRAHEQLEQSNAIIPFPFIGVLSPDPNWATTTHSAQELQLRFKELVHPFGDIDSLRVLQKHFK